MSRRKLGAEVSSPEEDAEGNVWVTLERDGKTAGLNLGHEGEPLADAALEAADMMKQHA